jgi:hypothetical protein
MGEKSERLLELFFLSIQGVQRQGRTMEEAAIVDVEHQLSACYATSMESASKVGFKKARKLWPSKSGWTHSVCVAQFDLSGKLIDVNKVRLV